MERAEDGRFYAIPAVRDTRESPLLDLLTDRGRLISSFGTCLVFAPDLRDINMDNAASLSRGRNGQIWVAFKHYPIVRVYASDCRLSNEFIIRHPIMAQQDAANRGRDKNLSGHPASSRIVVMNAMRFFGGKIYILRTHPCLEIMEIDPSGEIVGLYYWAEDFRYSSLDFTVVRHSEGLEFRVLNIKEQKIDLFR